MAQVSVVVPAYNAERFLGETIKSILAQTHTDLELIVVDDGSTDATADVVRAFDDCRIRYVHQENATLPFARNTGIREAGGEFIAFLDADDLWVPEKLAKQLPLFQHPAVGLTYTGFVLVDADGRWLSPFDKRPFHRGHVLSALLYDDFIPCLTVIVRRSLLQETGLRFRACPCGLAEDWDMWLRLARHTRFDYLDEQLAYYRIHSDSLSADRDRMLEAALGVLDTFEQEAAADPACSAAAARRLRRRCQTGRALRLRRRGHELLGEGRRREGRSLMRRALAHDPLALRSWWGLTKSLLPATTAGTSAEEPRREPPCT